MNYTSKILYNLIFNDIKKRKVEEWNSEIFEPVICGQDVLVIINFYQIIVRQ
jgi:hypothetical protein